MSKEDMVVVVSVASQRSGWRRALAVRWTNRELSLIPLSNGGGRNGEETRGREAECGLNKAWPRRG